MFSTAIVPCNRWIDAAASNRWVEITRHTDGEPTTIVVEGWYTAPKAACARFEGWGESFEIVDAVDEDYHDVTMTPDEIREATEKAAAQF